MLGKGGSNRASCIARVRRAGCIGIVLFGNLSGRPLDLGSESEWCVYKCTSLGLLCTSVDLVDYSVEGEEPHLVLPFWKVG